MDAVGNLAIERDPILSRHNEQAFLVAEESRQSREIGPRLAPLLAGLAFFAASAPELRSPAVAEGSTSTPAVTMSTVTSNPNLLPSTITIFTQKHAEERAVDVATKRIVIGEDVRLKGTNWKDCFWTKGAFTNSMRLANGKLFYYRDDKRGKLCRNPNSPTGWVKVAGGETGRKCINPAKPKAIPEKPVEVINVSKLNKSFTMRARAKANAKADCPGANASGGALAEIRQRFNLKRFLRMSGRGQARFSFRLYERAVTKAEARAECSSTEIITQQPLQPIIVKPEQPQQPPPQVEKPNQAPTGFLPDQHERIVNTTAPHCVDQVSDPDGDPVSVDFIFTNTRGQVTGQEVDDIFTQPGGAICQRWRPNEVGENTLTVVLADNRGGEKRLQDNIPVAPDQF